MAHSRVSNVIWLLNLIAHLCSCTSHENYKEYILESEKICHVLHKKQHHEIHDGTAAIVTPHHMFDRWIVKFDRNCTFVFKTARGEGLLAVIQKMVFRRHNNQCLDYIRFKRTDGYRTDRICGHIDRSKRYFSEPVENLYGMNDTVPWQQHDAYAEFDPVKRKFGENVATQFETEIVISNKELSDGESLDLTIIYTPYKSCNTINPEQYKAVGRNICIRKEYLCDKLNNCPLGMCLDEINCPYMLNDRLHKDDTATKVTVGAVTTMILCFIIFVMCLWICKKSQKLCWSSDCAGPDACSRPGSLREAEGGLGSNRAVPTAPMLEVAVSPTVADKDLPPSYDSLFPEQSNPARS